MKQTKQELRREIFKVFEPECNLDNYEFVALLDMFEELREADALPNDIRLNHVYKLHGALEFLTGSQHITVDQYEALIDSVNMVIS